MIILKNSGTGRWLEEGIIEPSYPFKQASYFGFSVSISHSFVVIGAPYFGIHEILISFPFNITKNEIMSEHSLGSAIFCLPGMTGLLRQTLAPPRGDVGEFFGWSVSGYQDVAVVGATRYGTTR